MYHLSDNMFKKLLKKIGFKNGDTKELAKILGAIFLVAILFGLFLNNKAQANCNGCGEDNHTNSCHEDAADHSHEKVDVVFAVCVFADGDLIDHKGSSRIAGKMTGKDKKKGKATLISLLGYDYAVKYCDKIILQVNKKVKKYGSNSKNIKQTLEYILNRDR